MLETYMLPWHGCKVMQSLVQDMLEIIGESINLMWKLAGWSAILMKA
jgi:hypothetical protein